MLTWAGLACETETAPEAPRELAAPAPAEQPAPPEEEEIEVDPGTAVADDLPLEPLVQLGASKNPPEPLPAFAPGTMRELVFEVRLQEKKALHVPLVRLAANTQLLERGAESLKLQWTPVQVVLPSTEGVDEAFLTAFQAALAPTDPPTTYTLDGDAWGSVTTLPWPASESAHVGTVAGGLHLALSHVVLPTPPAGLSKGAPWIVQRSLPVFGVSTWERIDAQAKKIDGDQLEVKADVVFTPGDPPATPANAFGMQVTAVQGKASLVARYDLVAGLPVDLQVKGTLTLTGADGGTKAVKVEVRADENYMAQPDPRVALTGEITDGGLVIGKAPPGTKVWFNKSALPVSDEGDFVFGFGRDAPPRALLAFSFEGGPPIRHILHVAPRTFEPEAIDGLPEEYVNLEKTTKKELAKSRRQVDKVRSKVSKVPYYRDGFIWPAKGKITSTYGRNRILNGQDKSYHWGVDIAGRVGKPVKAPAAGVVVLAEEDVPLSGNLLIIDHGHGVTSSFLHLQKFKVKVGDEVKQGQTVATLGNTGRSTGPHLDWRMNVGDTRIDPQLLVPPR